jgi:hypothetical protein
MLCSRIQSASPFSENGLGGECHNLADHFVISSRELVAVQSLTRHHRQKPVRLLPSVYGAVLDQAKAVRCIQRVHISLIVVVPLLLRPHKADSRGFSSRMPGRPPCSRR